MSYFYSVQISTTTSVEMEPEDPALKATVEALLSNLSLSFVGWIFTDLTDAGTNDGKVVYKRHADTFFLSSSEVV